MSSHWLHTRIIRCAEHDQLWCAAVPTAVMCVVWDGAHNVYNLWRSVRWAYSQWETSSQLMSDEIIPDVTHDMWHTPRPAHMRGWTPASRPIWPTAAGCAATIPTDQSKAFERTM